MLHVDRVQRLEVHVGAEIGKSVVGYNHEVPSAGFSQGFLKDGGVFVGTFVVSKFSKSLIVGFHVSDICLRGTTFRVDLVQVLPSLIGEDGLQV